MALGSDPSPPHIPGRREQGIQACNTFTSLFYWCPQSVVCYHLPTVDLSSLVLFWKHPQGPTWSSTSQVSLNPGKETMKFNPHSWRAPRAFAESKQHNTQVTFVTCLEKVRPKDCDVSSIFLVFQGDRSFSLVPSPFCLQSLSSLSLQCLHVSQNHASWLLYFWDACFSQ